MRVADVTEVQTCALRISPVVERDLPAVAQQGDRWQVTLHDGRLMWDLRLVRLTGDTLVLRQGTGDSTYRFPIGRVDELRLVHKAERRLRGEPRGYGSVLAGTAREI